MLGEMMIQKCTKACSIADEKPLDDLLFLADR